MGVVVLLCSGYFAGWFALLLGLVNSVVERHIRHS